MNLKRILNSLVAAVVEEAGHNPEFRGRLEEILKQNLDRSTAGSKSRQETTDGRSGNRKGGRRAPAVLDPIDLIREGEPELRARLSALELDLLLDIVAQFGMDPGKLVMKWKDRDRVIDRIVEVSSARATKGDSFRKE